MTSFGVVQVNTANPDPQWAIHALLRVFEKARSCGFSLPTEYTLAEQLLRREVKIVFYSTATGATQSYVESEDGLDPDDAFDMLMMVARKSRERRKRRTTAEAAQGIEAGTATTGTGVVHESPTPQGDAPDHTPYRSETNADPA